MTMHANGTGAAVLEDEASHYSNPEWEDETNYSNPYSNPEWESEASHYSNPEWEDETNYSNPYSNREDYSSPYSSPELEWEDETNYSNPYSNPEWEDETNYSNPYSNPESEDERDPFLPFLAPLAMKALPLLGKALLPAAKQLIPLARQAVPGIVNSVLGNAPSGPTGQPAPPPTSRPGMAPSPNARALIAQLMRQLGTELSEGESEAAELENTLFGANEFEGELGSNEQALNAALTESLAAESSHTGSESEAQSFLGTALPITIRIMGGGAAVRRVLPTLVRANARLVRGIRRSGPSGRQLLRTVPSIQRRTVASLKAAQRAGRPVTPKLAARVMAGQAARVLGTPHTCGRSIIRNAAIRRATMAPSGQRVRPPQRARTY